ncbi:hypothetical protein BDFB_001954 [Asbolus verrucosus]|uniref:Uncharacterized protein n=1 Tax=Asbolus verrucosus TaxID=1661398 RepID=A0A482V8Q9_ASBVE|nr:hypothetical protein BDFB_001954 [Asbolus verrucosus]
MIIVCPWTT